MAEEVTKLSYQNVELTAHGKEGDSCKFNCCRKADSLETELSKRDKIEVELRKRLEETKRHEEGLENELANLWVLVANMRKSGASSKENSFEAEILQMEHKTGLLLTNGYSNKIIQPDEIIHDNMDEIRSLEELKVGYEKERRRCKELEKLVSKLQVCTFE